MKVQIMPLENRIIEPRSLSATESPLLLEADTFSIEHAIQQVQAQQSTLAEQVDTLQKMVRDRDRRIEQLMGKSHVDFNERKTLRNAHSNLTEQLNKLSAQYRQLYEHCKGLLLGAKKKR